VLLMILVSINSLLEKNCLVVIMQKCLNPLKALDNLGGKKTCGES